MISVVDRFSDSLGDENLRMDYTVLENSHIHKFHLRRLLLERKFARIREVYQSVIDGRN